jgi:hypothetical protein
MILNRVVVLSGPAKTGKVPPRDRTRVTSGALQGVQVIWYLLDSKMQIL